MAYVITQNCCNDASCLAACPIGCIHPRPDEPDFATAEMLYIDPQACIDCGACADACPVGAIKAGDALAERDLPFVEVNAAFYRRVPQQPDYRPRLVREHDTVENRRIRVAIVGAGPAAWYAADDLLRRVPGAVVDMIDRRIVPWGLLRAGVAPDHHATKGVADRWRQPDDVAARLRLHLGVEVGVHVSHGELEAGHDAVVYATGAARPRTLDIAGEHLAGVVSGVALAGWFNGDIGVPGPAAGALRQKRAVVVGNGNVALDAARLLLTPPERLVATDMGPEALAALHGSLIREVVVLGRRGPEHAAFTLPELIGLTQVDGVDVDVEGPVDREASSDPVVRARLDLLADLAERTAQRAAGRGPAAERRVVLRFGAAPERILGATVVEGVRLADGTDLEAGLVVVSAGTLPTAVPGLPVDAVGRTPHEGGRVRPGLYLAGWAKRRSPRPAASRMRPASWRPPWSRSIGCPRLTGPDRWAPVRRSWKRDRGR
ncbi:MAG TPA: FAD-dependent oxidoreductase, partial [Acidimicrobiales bacterium]|nr:FAD-dependent oxidoreductase [Acidimicrobiales bacterium]